MKHVKFKCPEGCDEYNCAYCEGGPFICGVCGCSEVELAKECPGYPLTYEQKCLIAGRKVNFINGEFVECSTL